MCCSSFRGRKSSYVPVNFSNQIKRRAFIETGSFANALPESSFNEFNSTNPNYLTLEKPSFHTVRMASGQRVPIDEQAKKSFKIGPHYFQDSFLILPTKKCYSCKSFFFRKHNITIDPKNILVQLPDFTVQLNQLLPENCKK